MTIFEYVTEQENAYSQPIYIADNWKWGMKEHINTSLLYKNSQLVSGKNDNKPVKNITRPILNLQYRAEGFDVKDIELFVDSPKDYYKSFLVRKYHAKWARENDLDTFIDDLVESYVDYGGALAKNVNGTLPEVVPLETIAFCDQTDMLGGPIGIKHNYSPDQLLETAKMGWGDERNGATGTLQDIIDNAEASKIRNKQAGTATDLPGKNIEVYEVHGNLPNKFLKEDDDSGKYTTQVQIITYIQLENGQKQGVVLFAGKEKELPFKLLLRDKIYGRALGLGGAEELFEPQVWTNYSMIKKKDMIDAASKVIFKSTDPAIAKRNKIYNMRNMEIIDLKEGRDIQQLDTTPRNMALFDNSVAEWEAHAQTMGSANESIMGETPKSGTPFALQRLITAESHSLHEYRKGKIATFLDEIYRDWIIPGFVREMNKGQEFLASLELEELQEIADNVVTREVNNMVIKKILDFKEITSDVVDLFREQALQDYLKGGNKRFVKILKEDLKDAPISVRVNIAGKQKDLFEMTDKLVNVFRQLVATPQILDDPRMVKIFNQILESSGLDPINFAIKPRLTTAQPSPASATQPVQNLAEVGKQ